MRTHLQSEERDEFTPQELIENAVSMLTAGSMSPGASECGRRVGKQLWPPVAEGSNVGSPAPSIPDPAGKRPDE
eukprot:8646961-Heterocapsa_arctica.AAC.1